MTTKVALIGLGEVGRVFAEGIAAATAADVSAWDTAFADPGSKASGNADALGVVPAADAAEAVRGASLIVSAVTARNCVPAARAAAEAVEPGAYYFDLNSSSPAHKREAQAAVDAAGGRYVEAALMAPIHPRLLDSPFLLGGQHAAEFAAEADRYGITSVHCVSDDVGRAAATKLCRSVIVKGFEALMTESLLTARAYGVEKDVLKSLNNILPDADWEAIAGYFMSRAVQHGSRRAEEMEEAAATVADAGVDPWMSTAAVERQRWSARYPETLAAAGAIPLADALRSAAGLPHEPRGGRPR